MQVRASATVALILNDFGHMQMVTEEWFKLEGEASKSWRQKSQAR